MPNGVVSRPGWSGSTWQCSASSRVPSCTPERRKAGRDARPWVPCGRVVLQPHPLRALVAFPPEPGAVGDDGALGREGGVARVQGLAAGGTAAAGQRQADLVRGAGTAPARDLLAADGEHLGGAVRPVAAQLAVLPPDDQQLAVDVTEGELPPVVDGGGQPQGVPQQNAFRADDDGPFERVQDERGPGAGDTDVLRPVALLTHGGGLSGQFGVGVVERGPAQFVEDAGTQGGGEQRHDVVFLEEAHGFRGDVRDHDTERREPVESPLQPGEPSGCCVLLGAGGQPLPQDSGEHRVCRELRQAGCRSAAGRVRCRGRRRPGGEGRGRPAVRRRR